MEELGFAGRMLEDIYTNSTTQIKIGKHHTNDIHCEKGIKQGCPLNLILFDIPRAVDRWPQQKESYNFTQGEVTVLAYADDLCFIAEAPDWL